MLNSFSLLTLPTPKIIQINLLRFFTLKSKAEKVPYAKISVQLKMIDNKLEAILFCGQHFQLLNDHQLSILFMDNKYSAALVKSKIKICIEKLSSKYASRGALSLQLKLIEAEVKILVFEDTLWRACLDTDNLIDLVRQTQF